MNSQPMLALERANTIRIARAVARREIRGLPLEEAQARIAVLLEECPDWLRSEPVHILLSWMPRWGTSRINRTLSRLSINGVRPLGGLTDRQRQAIAQRVREA